MIEVIFLFIGLQLNSLFHKLRFKFVNFYYFSNFDFNYDGHVSFVNNLF